jgi:hypothetical protein
MAEKNYDSTIMRIAGNLMSGYPDAWRQARTGEGYAAYAESAVRMARAIVAETLKPDPAPVAPEEDAP